MEVDMRCKLEYGYDGFVPLFSSETMKLHYDGHHKNYARIACEMIINDPELLEKYSTWDLEAIVKGSFQDSNTKLFQNAAQVWNHNMFFEGIVPENKLTEELKNLFRALPIIQSDDFFTNLAIAVEHHISDTSQHLISKAFSSVRGLVTTLFEKSMAHFGSGWTWIVFDQLSKSVKVVSTNNADCPVVMGPFLPIANIDLWEHSYYVDYRNKKDSYYRMVLCFLDWKKIDLGISECWQRTNKSIIG